MWERLFQPLLTGFDPPNKRSRPRADQHRCLDGMIYRARTCCQWDHLPECFGSDSMVHRTVYRRDGRGVFDRLWALLIYHCEELQAVHWEWQAADGGCMNKARFIGKKGAKSRRARHRKGNKVTQKPVPGASPKAKGSAPPTVPSWALNRACWSRSEAGRFLCASQAPT